MWAVSFDGYLDDFIKVYSCFPWNGSRLHGSAEGNDCDEAIVTCSFCRKRPWQAYSMTAL